jgi:hypothetical protein
MTIYGMSQTSGVERRLKVERGGQGIVLTFIDHAEGKECQRIMAQGDDLMTAITAPPKEGATVEGICPPHGEAMKLNLHVRGNELQLTARDGSREVDVAVGLDDFMDALGAAVGKG